MADEKNTIEIKAPEDMTRPILVIELRGHVDPEQVDAMEVAAKRGIDTGIMVVPDRLLSNIYWIAS